MSYQVRLKRNLDPVVYSAMSVSSVLFHLSLKLSYANMEITRDSILGM